MGAGQRWASPVCLPPCSSVTEGFLPSPGLWFLLYNTEVSLDLTDPSAQGLAHRRWLVLTEGGPRHAPHRWRRCQCRHAAALERVLPGEVAGPSDTPAPAPLCTPRARCCHSLRSVS